jgi:catechol 2,3-dioxygenase
MTGVSHLGHVHLKVRDTERAVEFYESVLGLEVTERVGRFAFLTLGEHHHDLALQGVGSDVTEVSGAATGPEPGLYHAAWELEDADALRRADERLIERDVAVSPVDHGISKALYFDDPDGNGVELYLDTREERDIHDWDGRNERFDPSEL